MDLPAPQSSFSYFDGVKIVHADPLACLDDIIERTGGRPNDLSAKVFAVKPDTDDVAALLESAQAARDLDALVRAVFKMLPYDPTNGAGAQRAHCWKVWTDFGDFMADAKKKSDASAITSPSSAIPPASAPTGTNTSASS